MSSGHSSDKPSVNLDNAREQVNRSLAGLSKQQRDIIDQIARMKPSGVDCVGNGYYGRWGRTPPGTAGYYVVGAFDLVPRYEYLPEAKARSASASVARALARLEERGIIKRHAFQAQCKHSFYRFITLTDAGLKLANDIRRGAGLPVLEPVHYIPEPPMTEEEFLRRWEAIAEESNLSSAKAAAGQLNPESLEELRRWIEERLTSLRRREEVNQ